MKVLSIMAHELNMEQRDEFTRVNEGIVEIQQLKANKKSCRISSDK